MYLKFRPQTWWACHSISPRLRPLLGGRAEFARSTGERDKARARVVAAGFEQEWLAKIEAAKATLKDRARRAADPATDLMTIFEEVIEEAADAGDVFAKRWRRDSPPPAAGLADRLDDWLATLVNDRAKTIHMKKATITKFSSEFKHVNSVHRKAVQEWANRQITSGVAVATVRRSLSELRGYWGYLQSLEIVSDDVQPFDKLTLPKSSEDSRRAFEPGQVVALIAAAEAGGDRELADVIRVAAWTGGRLEEVAALEIADFLGEEIILRGTKTASAPRRLPVHSSLAPTLTRLAGDRKTGFLFAGLTENKFKDRSNAVGKRFGRLKTDNAYGEEYVFHSIRKTFSNVLWSAGVQRELISQLMGHKTGSITIDVYARDPQFKAKRQAIGRLVYPGYVPS